MKHQSQSSVPVPVTDAASQVFDVPVADLPVLFSLDIGGVLISRSELITTHSVVPRPFLLFLG